MSETAIWDGKPVTIGAGEVMNQLRHDQLSVVAADPDSIEVHRYSGTLYFRLPWPDEDGIAPGGFGARPFRELPVTLPGLICRACRAATLKLAYQRPDGDVLAAVLRCPSCGLLTSLPGPGQAARVIRVAAATPVSGSDSDLSGAGRLADRIAYGYLPLARTRAVRYLRDRFDILATAWTRDGRTIDAVAAEDDGVLLAFTVKIRVAGFGDPDPAAFTDVTDYAEAGHLETLARSWARSQWSAYAGFRPASVTVSWDAGDTEPSVTYLQGQLNAR